MKEQESKNHMQTAGFTLIELLVVLVIIGLLGAIVAPRFIGKGEKGKAPDRQAADRAAGHGTGHL